MASSCGKENLVKDDSVFSELKRLFHEPSRLSIMSILITEPSGMVFSEIKAACNLTDGNLNRHLKTLENAGAVLVSKKFVDRKPQTTVVLSREGYDQFNTYLTALEKVLKQARKAARSAAKTEFSQGELGSAH